MGEISGDYPAAGGQFDNKKLEREHRQNGEQRHRARGGLQNSQRCPIGIDTVTPDPIGGLIRH